jgi:hypothetical protein
MLVLHEEAASIADRNAEGILGIELRLRSKFAAATECVLHQ